MTDLAELSAELLPCPNPWCEGPEREGDFSPVAYRRQFGNWAVGCTSCSMDGPIRPTEAEAITAWNTRTGQLVERDGVAEVVGETQGERASLIDAIAAARPAILEEAAKVAEDQGAMLHDSYSMRSSIAAAIRDIARGEG